MATDFSKTLADLNEGIGRLQHSARRTIPMFVIGILATLIAAGAAVYYILSLSADARNSRHALAQSEAALARVTQAMDAANAKLREKEKTASSPADASAFKAAIANNSATQAIVSSASTAVRQAAARLDATDPSARPARLTAAHDSITPENAPELTGEFVTIETVDHFLVLRSQPSMLGALIRKVPSGSALKCAQAIPNENGNLWRPCTDDQSNSGYVANKFIRQQH
jgi:hypothetical protein